MNKIIEPEICHCSEAFDPFEGHYHCLKCDCILTSYEGNICCWCEEYDEKEFAESLTPKKVKIQYVQLSLQLRWT